MRVNLPKNSDQIEQWGPIDMRLLYCSFWFGPMSGAVKSRWGIYWAEMAAVIKNDRGTFYWWKNSLEKEGLKSIKRWLLKKDGRQSITKDYWKIVTKIQEVADQLDQFKPTTPFPEAQALALQWHKLYLEFWSLTDVFEIANYGAPEYLKKHLVKFIPEQELALAMEILLAPDKLSFNQQSEKELLECRVKANSKRQLDALIKNYAEQWHWLDNSYYQSRQLTSSYFLKKANNFSTHEAKIKLAEINKYPQTARHKKTEVVKKFRLPSYVAELASILSFSIWMQDHRKGVAWRSSDIATRFSKQLAKKLNAPLEDILHYSGDEWAEAFKTGKKLSNTVFTQRKSKLYAMYSSRGFYVFITGKEAKRIASHFAMLKDEAGKKRAKNLLGTVVSKGPAVIQGKVRILHSARDSKKMKHGEILVTAMTSPDFINAMRLAKAIITDVGGLMSHAAVISRELGIACIVNTKHATKMLKNGDLVEVDTNLGIIKKL